MNQCLTFGELNNEKYKYRGEHLTIKFLNGLILDANLKQKNDLMKTKTFY